jgi:hypothetical protein
MRFVLESKLTATGDRIRAVLIREGLSKNKNNWTRTALESLVKILEGVPVHLYDASSDGSRRMLDHWESWRARLRRVLPPDLGRLLPERFDQAQAATIRNPSLVIGRDGVAQVEADLEPAGKRGGLFRSLATQARRLGQVLGLSIHAPPDGVESREIEGGALEIANVSRVVGFDVVSYPSAGGRVLPVLEALARRRTMQDLCKRLLRLVPEDRRGPLEGIEPPEVDNAQALLGEEHQEFRDAIVEALELGEIDDAQLPAVLESMARLAPKEKPAPTKRKAKPKPARRNSDAGDGDGDDAGSAALESRMAELEEREAKRIKAAGRSLIDAVLETAKLPEKLTKFARSRLLELLESEGEIERGTIDTFVSELKDSIGGAQNAAGSIVEGEHDRYYAPPTAHAWTTGPRVEAALEGMLANRDVTILENGQRVSVPRFHSLRYSYSFITGDWGLDGARYYNTNRVRRSPLVESIDWDANPFYQAWRAKVGAVTEAARVTADYPLLLSNLQHKRLLKEYAKLQHVWRMIARTVPVADFKQRNIHQFGEFGQLAAVDEGESGSTGPWATGYVELTYPSEDDITATITKYGGLARWSWESIINDDLRKLQRIAPMMARAAERTLNTLVWGRILNNSNIYDGTALFTAGHGNLTSLAYSSANVKEMRKKMTRQKDLDDQEAGRFRPKTLAVGTELSDQAWEDVGAAGKADLERQEHEPANAGTGIGTLSHENPSQPNVLRTRYGLQVVEVHEFDEVAGADDNYYLAADPMVSDIMEVGFLNGREDPELFVQDLPRVGSMFDDDVIVWKVRHPHDGGVITDFRGFQGGIAP